ncbi:Ribbon-helix-helix domain-containing protein [Novosphingobium sp. CF614]|uniref:ribbon-helix-helix domain-containing protein n=1 Tax=Novosphingobium sp. CF614 TaxID=1884364 RepID=UPI0008EBAC6F|nr:ribbon-helix-helix domain-containing protein [Novosphingobium sp. CF614]SFF97162.1 Ribbon-helix-helix domain-containing protein [Novosphingobium sp. CF614]
MTRWNLVIPEETNRSVRSHLARLGGKKGDLSLFVDRAVRQAVFWETLDSVWKGNDGLSPAQAQALADEAVAETRAARS